MDDGQRPTRRSGEPGLLPARPQGLCRKRALQEERPLWLRPEDGDLRRRHPRQLRGQRAVPAGGRVHPAGTGLCSALPRRLQQEHALSNGGPLLLEANHRRDSLRPGARRGLPPKHTLPTRGALRLRCPGWSKAGSVCRRGRSGMPRQPGLLQWGTLRTLGKERDLRRLLPI